MIDDKLADEIVKSLSREPKRWKEGADKDLHTSWYVRDDDLRVGLTFVRRIFVHIKRGEYSSGLSDKRSSERVWKAVNAWREWLRVETLKSIANGL